jgi:iron complex transport system permease protein
MAAARTAARRGAVLVVAAAALTVSLVAAVAIGPLAFSPAEVLRALFVEDEGLARQVVWNLRLPRVLLAALVGASLAVAGSILQGVTRNPLADPYLLGISAGGVFAAVASITLTPEVGPAYRPTIAFAGALAAGFVTYLVAWRGGVSPVRLILAGVSLTSLLTAFTATLLVTSTASAQIAVSWLIGGFLGRGWDHQAWAWPYSVTGIGLALLLAREVNVSALGDELATSLGQRVERTRFLLIAVAALLAGSAVSVSGLIGFFGLVVPHIARLVVGSDYRYQLAAAALFGATLLVLADTAARTVLDPRELPVGVLTAAMGVPFLLYLIRRRA